MMKSMIQKLGYVSLLAGLVGGCAAGSGASDGDRENVGEIGLQIHADRPYTVKVTCTAGDPEGLAIFAQSIDVDNGVHNFAWRVSAPADCSARLLRREDNDSLTLVDSDQGRLAIDGLLNLYLAYDRRDRQDELMAPRLGTLNVQVETSTIPWDVRVTRVYIDPSGQKCAEFDGADLVSVTNQSGQAPAVDGAFRCVEPADHFVIHVSYTAGDYTETNVFHYDPGPGL